MQFVTYMLPRANLQTLKLGRDERIRTSDPLNPIQVRYQTAPRPDALIVHHPRRGVNP